MKKNRPYHYTECGLKNIYLLNGVEITKEKGDEYIYIHDIRGLHKTISYILVTKPTLLNGDEIRFIRHTLDLSQKRFGSLIGCTYQSILAWEKDKTTISPAVDKLLKMMFARYLDPESTVVHQIINEIADLDAASEQEKQARKIQLAEEDKHWQRVA